MLRILIRTVIVMLLVRAVAFHVLSSLLPFQHVCRCSLRSIRSVRG
jgi:hypothetical protein